MRMASSAFGLVMVISSMAFATDSEADGSAEWGRCRPNVDLACTVIHETRAGVIVWSRTFGAEGLPGQRPRVLLEEIPGTRLHTIRILPGAAATSPTNAADPRANGAPILE